MGRDRFALLPLEKVEISGSQGQVTKGAISPKANRQKPEKSAMEDSEQGYRGRGWSEFALSVGHCGGT
jgi:hypothetical protein